MNGKGPARTALFVGFSTLLLAGTALAAPGDLTLASTSADGVKGDSGSSQSDLSADGTRIAFSSGATNFDPGDTDNFGDVYVKNLLTGDITVASTSDSGVKSNFGAGGPTLSADGTRVAFVTLSNNLDPADTDNEISDIYVKDLVSGDISLASTSDSGVKSNDSSFGPQLSADGTTVAFWSHATNLDPADTEVDEDAYVKNLATGDITLANTTDDGVRGGGSAPSGISADGTRVAITSGSNLDPADTDNRSDVYVKDLVTGDITLASTSDDGVKSNGESMSWNLSADGTRVVFLSDATNLDPTDTDQIGDIYVKDIATGELFLASTSDNGVKANAGSGDSVPSLSEDGTTVAFKSSASNLDPADTDTIPDIYVKSLTTGDITLASTSEGGAKGNGESIFSSLSADGSRVAFSSAATNLDPADTDTAFDIYVKELGPSVASADLSVSKSDGRDPVRPGVQLVYTVKVDNLGPDTATDVTVADRLPLAARFVSARPTQGGCHRAGSVLTCELGTVPSGGNANVRIVVKPLRLALIRNTVEVIANESDPTVANNSDVETTRVR